jgi:aldose 1-epimerase
VAGTPVDFRTPKTLGEGLRGDNRLLEECRGYDINFVLRCHGIRHAADLYDPNSGRGMKVMTDMPGLQLYTANDPAEELLAGGVKLKAHQAVCLETQFFPDSPNRNGFPGSILDPNVVFKSVTIYQFYAGQEMSHANPFFNH